MNRSSLVVAGFLAAAEMYADSASKAPARVPVCIAHLSHTLVSSEARGLTSLMFEGVGVKIVWRDGLVGCEPGSIRIAFSEVTPPDLRPGALAYAMPYAGFKAYSAPLASASLNEGFHICILYDRIQQIMGARLTARLLAHVLTHEITHVLQGLMRHSTEGIMKARWTQNDYAAMLCRQLVLTRDDIELLHIGIAVRAEVLNNAEKLAHKGEKVTAAGGS